jgi:ribosomal-protein-alanine N-acetyltransferase
MSGTEKSLDRPVRIRRMTKADIDGVWEVEKLCFPDPWSREAFEAELSGLNPTVYFVAEAENGTICGYMGVWHILDEGHITNVAVRPDCRRLGIGRQLVEAVLADGHQKGIYNFTLEVRVSNEAARALYRELGFEPAGVRKRYYSDGEDALIMWLTEKLPVL